MRLLKAQFADVHLLNLKVHSALNEMVVRPEEKNKLISQ
jgi:hypothetical protein